jgi:hypothetical protein
MQDRPGNIPIQQVALTLGSVGLLIAVAGVVISPRYSAGFLVGGLVTLLLAGGLSLANTVIQRREKQQVIARLVEQIHSPNRRARLLAVEDLRARGWLKDGSLRGADLAGTDLQGANLSGADLRHTSLKNANLRGADLHWADLGEADLTGAHLRGANLLWADLHNTTGVTDRQLSTVYILRRATMPDGTWYDGRYNLRGDIDDAGRDRIKPHDEEGMARWYEVSLQAYQHGQAWAVENLAAAQERDG